MRKEDSVSGRAAMSLSCRKQTKQCFRTTERMIEGKQVISEGHGIAYLAKQTQEIVSNSFHAL